jgi:hypothetical protein
MFFILAFATFQSLLVGNLSIPNNGGGRHMSANDDSERERSNNSLAQPDPRAMEEWNQLQIIIGRHEGLEFQIRGWLLLLLVALVAALFDDARQLSPTVFLVVGVLVIAAFGFMELMIRVPKREAIDRVGKVETALRGEQSYDGPAICRTLSRGPGTSAWSRTAISEIQILWFWTFYLPLLAVVGIIAGSAR